MELHGLLATPSSRPDECLPSHREILCSTFKALLGVRRDHNDAHIGLFPPSAHAGKHDVGAHGQVSPPSHVQMAWSPPFLPSHVQMAWPPPFSSSHVQIA